MSKILVSYASKHGSTAEIAESIGESLRERGYQVDVMNVREVKSLRPYTAVVLGSAIYSGEWMKEALSFLRTHQLSDLPLYLFSSGPIGDAMPNQGQENAVPNEVQKLVNHLYVSDVQLFHGKVELRKLSIAELSIFQPGKTHIGDFRQWDRIKLWAQHISDTLAHQ